MKSKYVPPSLRSRKDDGGNSSQSNNNRFSRDNFDPPQNRFGNEQKRGGWGDDRSRFDRRDPGRGSSSKNTGDIRSRGNRFSRGVSSKAAKELDTVPNPEYELELFGQRKSVAMGINFAEYDKIPVDVSGVDCPAAIDSFDELLITEALLNNISLCKFSNPTPIQKYSIPTVLANRDLMACAQTGSGKTAAFLIPVIESLSRQGNSDSYSRSKFSYYPRALILAPTRELAQQIHEQARKLTYCCGMRAVCVYGGANIHEQFQDLASGVGILVATPGRLWDMMDRGKVVLDKVAFLVMDEADRMLDMGFEPQIRQIVDHMTMPPAVSENGGLCRRTLMYSATFPDEIQALAQDFLHDYIFLAVGRVGSTTNLITQQLKYVETANKTAELLDLIPTINGKCLVFTATKRTADTIEGILCRQGHKAITIHGDKSQSEREFALHAFRDGDTNLLVATDVAARGLDIPNVTWVVQYDLPGNIDDYVHRIGRTGRRGNQGTALSFTNESNRPIFDELLRLLQESGQEVPSWFTKMISNTSKYRRGGRFDGGRRNRRGPKQSYGGRDVREPVRRAEPSNVRKVRVKGKKQVCTNDAW